ncbi:MAG TPA: hypothetical protein VLD39_03405 [Gammaproteobacteria bacterium]|nr:hypothetical protein [Gammaproteobacteria bacterium]
MNDQPGNIRRSVLAGLGVAAAGLTLSATVARAQSAAPRAAAAFAPARHALDAWLDQMPGTHRVFIDSATAVGGAEALLYANNLFMARENAYAGEPADFAMVVCFRHFSTPFGYNDAVWAKYGEVFNSIMHFPDPTTGAAPTINLMNSSAHTTLQNFGVTVDAVGAKGAEFAICAAATQFIAGVVAGETGGDAAAIREELIAGAIPNSRFVSAGVMALTRAQEYGYSLLYAG